MTNEIARLEAEARKLADRPRSADQSMAAAGMPMEEDAETKRLRKQEAGQAGIPAGQGRTDREPGRSRGRGRRPTARPPTPPPPPPQEPAPVVSSVRTDPDEEPDPPPRPRTSNAAFKFLEKGRCWTIRDPGDGDGSREASEHPASLPRRRPPARAGSETSRSLSWSRVSPRPSRAGFPRRAGRRSSAAGPRRERCLAGSGGEPASREGATQAAPRRRRRARPLAATADERARRTEKSPRDFLRGTNQGRTGTPNAGACPSLRWRPGSAPRRPSLATATARNRPAGQPRAAGRRAGVVARRIARAGQLARNRGRPRSTRVRAKTKSTGGAKRHTKGDVLIRFHLARHHWWGRSQANVVEHARPARLPSAP